MGATGFNKVRREAAERARRPIEEIPYEQAIEILKQPQEQEPDAVDRETRIAELKAANWETLRDLLKAYELPINKPKGVSWDEFAIPQILEHEGL
jgi:hypothetical protein